MKIEATTSGDGLEIKVLLEGQEVAANLTEALAERAGSCSPTRGEAVSDEAQSKRMAIADQILRIAHDVDFGASPEFTARELRKLVQIVQPGYAATPANPNDSARWLVNDERLTALERELQELRASLKKQSDAFASLARSCEVK